jgi:hypothetical protein
MKKSAFSILELAIVLIIIGLLTAGIAKGGAMIKSSRIAGARAVTSSSEVAKIDGLLAWFETSIRESILPDETNDGALLTRWVDISPSSIMMQKNTATKNANNSVTYVSEGINNIPSIRFNGNSNGSFEVSQLFQGSANQVTLFVVLRPEANTNSVLTFFDAASGNNSFSAMVSAGDIVLNAGNGAPFNSNIESGKNYIIAAYFNMENSVAYVNDAENASDMFANAGSNSLNGITIGNNKNNSAGFGGLISEIIIYNRPLKLNERKDVMRYLAKKYKINVNGI